MHILVLRNQRTYTHTAQRITLAHRVNEYHTVLYTLQVERRDIRTLRVDKLTIHLVGEEIEVILLDQIADLHHLLLGIEIARRIVGVTNQDSTRLLRNLLLKLLYRRQFEAVLDIRLHGFDDRTTRDRKSHIIGITGVCDDNLIARIETSHIGKHDGLRTTRSDDNLIGRDVDTILCIIAHHLRSKREYTLRWRIRQNITLEGRNSIFGTIGRLNVGLTNVERIDVNTITVRRLCILRQLTDRRLRHALCTFRDFHGRRNLRVSACKITKKIAYTQEKVEKFAYLQFL